METGIPKIYVRGITQFKSYYVVWKLDEHISELEVAKEFKSYYVVWKLKWKSMEYILLAPFKSYYVVWKLRKDG